MPFSGDKSSELCYNMVKGIFKKIATKINDLWKMGENFTFIIAYALSIISTTLGKSTLLLFSDNTVERDIVYKKQ